MTKKQNRNRELLRLYREGLLEAAAAKKLVGAGWPATLEAAFTRMSAREIAQERYQHLGRVEEPMEVAALSALNSQCPKRTTNWKRSWIK